MSLAKVYRAELFKVLKKPVTLLLLICLILPAFYVVSIMSNASHIYVQGNFDAMLFASINWNMLTMAGIPEILLALLITHIFAYEVEQGQIKLMLVRVCSRKKLFIAKYLVFLTLTLGLYLIYYIFCIILYYLCIVRTPLGNGLFIAGIESAQYMLMDLIYIIQIIIVCNIVVLLGMYYKAFTSFMMGIGVTTAFIVFQFFPSIKYFVPAYIATAISHMQISNSLAIGMCVIYMIISFVPLVLASRSFGRRDMK